MSRRFSHSLLPAMCVALLQSGCAGNATVAAADVTYVGGISIVLPAEFIALPQDATLNTREDSIVYTRHGPLLDRIVVIPDIRPGEPVFEPQGFDLVDLPPYTSGMQADDVRLLVETSLYNLFDQTMPAGHVQALSYGMNAYRPGNSGVRVATSNLRPQQFTSSDSRFAFAADGFVFDLKATLADGPDYKGIAGGFVYDDKLYLVIYTAATPYYFDAYADEARTVISSAHVSLESALAACGPSVRCKKQVRRSQAARAD